MVCFNSGTIEKTLKECLGMLYPSLYSKPSINMGEKQKKGFPIINLDSLSSVHGLVLDEKNGRLFAFFSKEPYEEMIVNYKGELYGVMERVGEVHYLKYLNI